jgi:hypothetical protein
MIPHMKAVFDERDRLYAELEKAVAGGFPDQGQIHILTQYHAALEEDPDLPKGPTFNALLMPHAVENIRAKLKEGKIDE